MPDAGLLEPLELFTLVAVVLFTAVLLTALLVVRLLVPVASVDTVEAFLLTVLLTPDPPLRELPPPAESLSEPV